MTVVVDASVALKWVIEEDGSAAARRLGEREALVAPELLIIECANVLAMRVRRGLLAEADAAEALAVIDAIPIRVAPGRRHVAAAQAVAFALRQTAYDSLYLAVAMAERVLLVTADIAFARAASAHRNYAPFVRPLE